MKRFNNLFTKTRYFYVTFNIIGGKVSGVGAMTFSCFGMFDRDKLIDYYAKSSVVGKVDTEINGIVIGSIFEMSDGDMKKFAPTCPFLGVV